MKKNYSIDMLTASGGSLDFSYLLDAPAGKHGFVTAKDGHFYFEDGLRSRFIGFNIAARSNTPSHEMAEKMANRFASLGVNVIRMHAADAPMSEVPRSWASSHEHPLIDYKKGNSRCFNSEGLDRFDYLFAKLKEKGIYIHIDLIVARQFLKEDGLDYDTDVASCSKCFCMFNEKLIELQKEFASAFLTHVNPYTGLAYIDDPAVMTVQINNEDSSIKGTMDSDWNPAMDPYRNEVREKWNKFLLEKYGDREGLKKAWTFDGKCALKDSESPEENTVEGVAGGFYQPTNDPTVDWDADVSPVRYADYMEFGIKENKRFYEDMKAFLIKLGVKVPIVASNLVAGAADVYGHTTGDVMENNAYFNHPLFPLTEDGYNAVMPSEYVSANPLELQTYVGAMANTILSMGAIAATEGKPFMLSEWNDYGLVPFHSTSFMHTVAYACLNDWDGLILYNYQTTDEENCPADEILSVFDAYNDPSLICQWGIMAEVFLKGLVAPAKNQVDFVYTQNDLKTLPNMMAAPIMYLPYVTKMRNVFLEDEKYHGKADAAVNAGFVNYGDLSEAKHGVYYSWLPYKDVYRSENNPARISDASVGSRELKEGVHLSDKNLCFDDIAKVAGTGNYTEFAGYLDKALKEWSILDESFGLTDGALISDTGELTFNPAHSQFSINSPKLKYFSGAVEGTIELGPDINVSASNEKLTLALLNRVSFEKQKEYLLLAMGGSGMDQTNITEGIEMMGMPITHISMQGKLYVDTLEGQISVRAKKATMQALSQTGQVIAEIVGERKGKNIIFTLDGNVPATQFTIVVIK